MHWQARFDQENPDQDIIHEMHKLRKACYLVNKKKLPLNERENRLNANSYTRKSRKYSSYRGDTGKPRKTLLHRRFYTSVVHQKITTDMTELKYYERDSPGELRQKKVYLARSWTYLIAKFSPFVFLNIQTPKL